jgi:hypothetical protein
MAIMTKGSSAARTALIYVTVGALTLVWTAVYFFYKWNHTGPADNSAYYWCAGFLATGLTLLLIGFFLGRIGRSARHAELPPKEVTPAVANAEQNAAARAHIVAPSPAAPVVAGNGQPAVAPVPPVATAPATPAVPATNTPAAGQAPVPR